MLSDGDWLALWVDIRLALVTTAILLLLCTLAWWLARRRVPGAALLEAIFALPLVLPPSVLGFYLLIALGPQGPGGWLAQLAGMRSLAFSFRSGDRFVVFASLCVATPEETFVALDQRRLDMAAVAGRGHWIVSSVWYCLKPDSYAVLPCWALRIP